MENVLIEEQLVCSFCKKEIEKEVIFCSHCGHPENGTEKQRAQFFAKRAMQKNKNIDAGEKIKSARNTLFVLCGLIILFGLFSYSSNSSLLELGLNFFVGFIYLVLAFWSEKKPFIALLIGLFLYITLVGVSAIIDPLTLIRGVIWKVVIISYLGKGLYSAYEMKKQS
ncbi:conserved membrane protein of unknown function [Tenacibaculum sp. 190130A14a]|uniref:Zinc ribbon domain-containing protein n=1 Tax=Tenacibaculum polynesiense TaxID=3137857 RepID=A0ABP1F4C0_9FLAO